jgi:hypothetical protein
MEPNKFELEQPGREQMLAFIEKQRPDMAEKLRVLLGRESFLKGKNVYGELYAQTQINICYDTIFRAEYLRCRILEVVREGAKSVKQIAERLGKTPGEILPEVVELRRKNLMAIDRIEDRTPFYRAS